MPTMLRLSRETRAIGKNGQDVASWLRTMADEIDTASEETLTRTDCADRNGANENADNVEALIADVAVRVLLR